MVCIPPNLATELQETPETATQNLAYLIGFAWKRMSNEQRRCACDSLRVLARAAGVPDDVVEAALS